MPVSAGMISHLASSPTTLCTLWRVEERRREVVINWDVAKRINCVTRGGWVKKNAGTDGTDDAGVLSTTQLQGNGYLRFMTKRNGTVYCGLSNNNATVAASSIQHAIRCDADGTVKIYESGTLKATMSGTARKGDWLTIKRVGTAVTYWRNRTLIYTSATVSSGVKYADVSIATKNATVEQAVFGFNPTIITVSNHTRNLTYNGELYRPVPLSPSRLAKSAGLKADNAELVAVLSSDGFTQADLIGGRWSHSRVEMIVVNYEDLSLGPARRSVGYMGEVQLRNGLFTAEFRGLSQLLQQEIGESTSALCRAKRFGGFDCGVNLAAYSFDCGIASVGDALHVTIDLSPAKANDYFAFGLIYWRTGNNQFYEREIKGNVGNALELTRPMPVEVQTSDFVTVVAGCARTRAACKTFANADTPSGTNIENFQGEPDIPGLSKVYSFPE